LRARAGRRFFSIHSGRARVSSKSKITLSTHASKNGYHSRLDEVAGVRLASRGHRLARLEQNGAMGGQGPDTSLIVLTSGHFTRSLEESTELFKAHGVTRVVDVRTVPLSRRNPKFNRETFPEPLAAAGIGSLHTYPSEILQMKFEPDQG
jgi:hypothetical protein